MRILITLVLAGLTILCGCNKTKHYVRGQGDVGQFILRQAVAFGGHLAATNGLPTIIGNWKYVQDEYGVGILLSQSQYQPIQDFVRAAFGPPSNSAGWSARDFGVTIMIEKTEKDTSVGIFPAMSDKKWEQGILDAEKSTR